MQRETHRSRYWSKALLASTSSFLSRADGMAPSSKGGSYLLLHGDLERTKERDGPVNHSKDAWPVHSESNLSCLKFRGQVTKRLPGEAYRAAVQMSADWLVQLVMPANTLAPTPLVSVENQATHSLSSGYFEEQTERKTSHLATNISVSLCPPFKWSAGAPRLPDLLEAPCISDNKFEEDSCQLLKQAGWAWLLSKHSQ